MSFPPKRQLTLFFCSLPIKTCGAEPLFFLDYLATGKLSVPQLTDVVKVEHFFMLCQGAWRRGQSTTIWPVSSHFVHQPHQGISEGCLQANCGLLGGETAEMPGGAPFSLSPFLFLFAARVLPHLLL
jgi:hypothetical protein